jgi:DNA ligase-associated metallophosphoesterase
MLPSQKFELQGQTFWLSPERCIYWQDTETLIVADIHFGKSGHFRKEGIGIPQTVFKEDLQRLFALIQHYSPKELLVVGDFFHSHMNSELRLFEKWRNDLPQLHIHLVQGNHDLLPAAWYGHNGIELHETVLQKSPFDFVHDITFTDGNNTGSYRISGHIHPGIRIEGMAKQSLRFPCFYFGHDYAVLPAFSRFTGLHTIKPRKKERVFAIVEKSIIEITH